MALKKCRECGKEVSSKAKTCPHCGVNNPVKKNRFWKWVVFLGSVGIIYGLFSIPSAKIKDANVFSKTTLNVRDMPTTDSKVVGKLSPGQKVLSFKDSSGWLHIKFLNNGNSIDTGWIAKSYTYDISKYGRWKEQQESRKPPTTKSLKINSKLTNFTVDNANSQFVFTLQVENKNSQQDTVFVVVYGKNDNFIPPRRSAWPAAGLLFKQAGTARGNLSASDISDNWNSRPEITKGFKMILKSNSKKSIEGAFPINRFSQLQAWQGEVLNPNSMYDEIHLWIFSQNGELISNKGYNIK